MFYLHGKKEGPTVDISMMNMFGKVFKTKRIDTLLATALEMPSIGNKYSVIFILPDCLSKTEDKISSINLDTVLDFTNSEITVEHVAIPKFQVKSTCKLNDPLKSLGIVTAFNESLANFNNISDTNNLFITLFFQKILIEFDEHGFLANSTTAICMDSRGFSRKIEKFICNKPFFFIIRDNKTRSILFTCKVINPN